MASPFDYLLQPVAFDEFLSTYYERHPLLVQERASSYYDRFIRIEDINSHLGHGNVVHPGVRLVKLGQEVDPGDYTRAVSTSRTTLDIADKETIFVKFFEGHTIILNSFERHSAGILQLRHIAERAFSANAHANIYITPRNTQGFKPHWDNHDVFVLQFEGTKLWTIYNSPQILPGRRQQFVDGEWTPGDVMISVRLSPGDLLYIPRGFVHEASADNCVSGHVTLGITTLTYADLALRVIENIDTVPGFRESLPTDFKSGIDQESFVARLQDYLWGIDVQAILTSMYSEFVSTRMPDASDRLADYMRLPSLDAATILRQRAAVLFDVEYKSDEVVVRFNNKAIYFPPQAGDCIREILHLQSFCIGDLTDRSLDMQSKTLICVKLVEEGLLTLGE